MFKLFGTLAILLCMATLAAKADDQRVVGTGDTAATLTLKFAPPSTVLGVPTTVVVSNTTGFDSTFASSYGTLQSVRFGSGSVINISALSEGTHDFEEPLYGFWIRVSVGRWYVAISWGSHPS